MKKVTKLPTIATPYLRGDAAASDYLGFSDPQGRTFRKWADKVGLPFNVIGSARIYRKADIDRAWINNASNALAFTAPSLVGGSNT